MRSSSPSGRAYGKAGGAAGPFTEAEVKWLEAVTPRLIRRAAEYEAKVPSLPQITMADLPPACGRQTDAEGERPAQPNRRDEHAC
jgi:hypothetical protein